MVIMSADQLEGSGETPPPLLPYKVAGVEAADESAADDEEDKELDELKLMGMD